MKSYLLNYNVRSRARKSGIEIFRVHNYWNPILVEIAECYNTVEPRFNEVAGDRPNLFVESRVRYIENLVITNFRGNDQNVRYIEVIVND